MGPGRVATRVRVTGMPDLLDEEIGSGQTDRVLTIRPTQAEVLELQIDPTRSYFGYLKGLDRLDGELGRDGVGSRCIVTLKWFMSQFWYNILRLH